MNRPCISQMQYPSYLSPILIYPTYFKLFGLVSLIRLL